MNYEQYEVFFNGVMHGSLGPTSQYWCIYVYMINRVHRELMRALRTNDVDRYIIILPAVLDIFFGLNRPNYARWGVLFLRQLKEAAPQSREILSKGAFSIRRTAKNYSRTAIDLSLEQTVNRDAASPMRGIVGFHNSDNAVRRWCVTSTQRGMSVTLLRRLSGLETEEQPETQLRSSRIKKDNQDINALLDAVTASSDPFSPTASTSGLLLNIATGKAASSECQGYLTETLEEGRVRRKSFHDECAEDETRFMKPIRRRKVLNFAYENKKRKHPTDARGKSVTESVRDVFIRMLVIVSAQTNFNLRHVVTFPITEFPLSIAHSDGSRMKTDKSKLLKKLESMQNGFDQTSLPQIDVTLIDGGLLLHSFLSAIGHIVSYGNLARSVLAHVCSNHGSEIHVLFDTYIPVSLKESERKLRGAEDHPYVISGPEQSPKQSCQKLLQNGIFKDQLAMFLIREWRESHYGLVLGNKTLFVSHGGNCTRFTFSEEDSEMNVDHPEHLQGSHEEADTLLAFHSSTVVGTAMIRASDTDVLVIMLGMLGKQLESGTSGPASRIIMDCGSGNARRYIDVTNISAALEEKQAGLTAAMPGLHAFTGCDYTAAFYRKGKVKPLQILENDEEGSFIEFFSSMSCNNEPCQAKAEEFVCSMYGMKGETDVNEARYAKLIQMTGRIDRGNPMATVRKVDCSLIPPCAKTLQNKIKRAHYVSIVWRRADTAHPDNGLDPRSYGWREKDGVFISEWFEGPDMPEYLFHGGSELSGDPPDQPDLADFEFDDVEEASSEAPWSDDSDNETES